jgi:MipA family protein
MQSYFGVDQTQASTSAHSQFSAESGFKSVGFGVELDWAINEHWMVNGGLEFSKLTNDAADSPFVKNEGSDTQMGVMAALIYKF